MAISTQQDALAQARAALQEQNEVLERLAKAPLIHGTVIRVGPKRLTIVKGGGDLLDVEKCKFDLKPGDGVLIEPEGGQILEKTESLPCGEPVTVLRIVDQDRIEVSVNGGNKIVFVGTQKLKENDEILLDRSGYVAVHTVKVERPRFAVTHATDVTWDSIGGQAEAKAAMREVVELPLKSPAIFKAYNKRPAKGVLLSGPPGCGKTMLGKAAATAIAQLTKSGNSGFLYIKGPEVLDPYVGVAEATVRKIFLRAKEHKAIHGSPAVVFIDEADAILGKRGTIHSFMEKTIVPAFLTEMDGMEDSGALIILATNRPDTLDPAVIRDGRIDRKIMVSRPSLEDTAHIFKLYLDQVPLHKDEDVERLSVRTALALFDKSRALYHVTLKTRDEIVIPLSALASGALAAGIVDKAVSLALNRDLEAGAKKATGVTYRDMIGGVVMTHRENMHVDHSDAIHELTGGHEIIHHRRGVIPELEAA